MLSVMDFAHRNDWKLNQICVIKLWSDADWYLILLHILHLQKQRFVPTLILIFFFKVTRWWNSVKHKLAGEKFNELTSPCLPAEHHADRSYLGSWRAVNPSDSRPVLPGCLTVAGRQVFFFFFLAHNLKLQKLLFPDIAHYNLQLSSEFRLRYIIIVSECQTGNLKTVMMR